MRQYLRRAGAVLAVWLAVTGAAEAQIQFRSFPLDEGPPLLLLQGAFLPSDDPEALARAVRASGARFVTFNSEGGNVVTAMAFGRMIRALGLGTVQTRETSCASACTLAFFGGVERYAEAGALGVHQAWFPSASGVSSEVAVAAVQLLTGQIIEYLEEMGVDPRLMQLSLSTSSDDMRYLTAREMSELRVTTKPNETPSSPSTPPRRGSAYGTAPTPTRPTQAPTPSRSTSYMAQPTTTRPTYGRSSPTPSPSRKLGGSVSADLAGFILYGPSASLELGWGNLSLTATGRAPTLGMLTALDYPELDEALQSGYGVGVKARHYWGERLLGTFLGLSAEYMSLSIEKEDILEEEAAFVKNSTLLVPQIEFGFRGADAQRSGAPHVSTSLVLGYAHRLSADVDGKPGTEHLVKDDLSGIYVSWTFEIGIFF